MGDAIENKKIVLKEQRKGKQFDGLKRSIWRKITAPSPTALMLFNVNYFMYVHRFSLETYLLLDGLRSQDDDSHLAACLGSTGLHVTSSKNDPDLTTNIHYIMDSTETTETIKLSTLLSTTIWTRNDYL